MKYMTTVECSSPHLKLVEPQRPNFGLCRVIPEGMAPQIEMAVRDFIESSHLPDGVDREGFFRQTLQAIAAASYLNQGGELWLGFMGGRLVTYILAHVGNDYDGRLAMTVTQAWVRKDQRGQSWVKEAWEKVRQRAKDCLCKHFSVLSSRGNDKAYCRFLGKGFHFYASILKEEI
jgi:hypothetical protein